MMVRGGQKLGWWFHIFLIFTPNLGEMIQFDLRILFKWVGEKPPTSDQSDEKLCRITSFFTNAGWKGAILAVNDDIKTHEVAKTCNP